MPTLNIQGHRVNVDDAFLSMSPDEQDKAVDEIARSLPAASSNPAGHDNVPEYVPPGVKGYDPKTGEVAPGQYTSPMDKLGAFSSSVLNGVPIAGPYLKEGVEALGAKVGSLISGQPENQLRYAADQATERAVHDNPYTSLAGNVTGSVAGTMPVIAAAPQAFGIGTGSKVLRALAAGGSGSALATADTAVRTGGDVAAMKKSAMYGAGAGVGGQLVGPLVGKTAQAVVDNLQIGRVAKALGLDKQAANFIKSAAVNDALKPATAREALTKLGSDGMLLDLGDNMKQLGAGLVTLPGEGRQIVKGAIKARDADANWRIRSALDGELGPAPVPSQVIDRIGRNQQRLQPEYRQALRDAAPVDTLPIARYLDQEAQSLRGEPQRVVQRVRSMLDHQPTPADIARARANGQPVPGTSLVTDAAELLNTRHAIDDMLETTQGSNAVNALTTARQAVDDELRASVPGIKEVDAKYSELARQRTALQRGQTVLASGREAPRPSELSDEFTQGALPQGMQIGPSAVPVRLREGARAEIERLVGTKANDRVALQGIIKGEGDWNRARLSTLFGRDKASAIIDVLDRERAFADTAEEVIRNSHTAARSAAQKMLKGANDQGFGVVDAYAAGGVPGAVRGMAIKGGDKVLEALRGVKNANVHKQLAETLTGKDSAVLNALLSGGINLPVTQIDRVARALLLSGPSHR